MSRPRLLPVALVALGTVLLMAAGTALLPFARRLLVPMPSTPRGWSSVVETIAGDGAPGSLDGPAAKAQFSDPFGVVVDGGGHVFVADAGTANRIRRISPDGLVTSLAGEGEGFADGAGRQASFDTPSGLAIGREGVLYVADTGNHAVRRVTPDGEVTTLAGGGTPGDVDGAHAQARFNGPVGVAVDQAGNVFVADTYNDRIRKVAPDGVVTTVAGGTGPGYRDGPASQALFDTPCGLAVAPDGALLIADTGNDAIRRLDPEGGVTTVGGTGPGLGVVHEPIGLAVTRDGVIYATDRRGLVVQIDPAAGSWTIAGTGPGFADGQGERARFNRLAGLALGPENVLVVVDAGSYLIRRIDPRHRPQRQAASPERGPSVAQGITSPEVVPSLARESLGIDGLRWPVEPQTEPREIAGTVGEARGGVGTDGRARFHAGLDVPGDRGAIVSAVTAAKIASPLPVSGVSGFGESLETGPLRYVHLRVGRDGRDRSLAPERFIIVPDDLGRPGRVRVRRGTKIGAGDPLGTINDAWHAHLELGPRGAELNPLIVPPVGLVDRVPPTIRPGGVWLVDRFGRRLTERRHGRLLVSGPLRIVVDAYDQVDGSKARRRLGVHRLGYQVLTLDETPAPGFEEPRVTIEFDRLSPNPAAPSLVFEEGSGITVYGNRVTRFLYNVTNIVRTGEARPGVWDTSRLPPGDYVLRVLVADFAGNVATNGRDVPVTVKLDEKEARLD